MKELASALSLYGDKVLAVDDFGSVLTYTQASQAAQKWRAMLGEGKKLVLLLCRNTCPALEAYIGLVSAGYATMLIGADTAYQALEDIKQRYLPDVIIIPDDNRLSVEVTDVPSEMPVHPDVAVLLSTSGSTGTPKFAQFSHSALYANAEAIKTYLALTSQEHPMVHLPMHYSYGMSVINSHILAGATLILSEKSVMEPGFWARMNQENATSLSGVPFHYEILLRLGVDRKAPASLRTLTQAGGRLAPQHVTRVAELAQSKGWQFFVMYGQTEAGPRISYVPPEHIVEKPGTIGRPIPNVQIELRDDTGSEITATNEEGEMVVHSPSIMMGYAQNRSDLNNGDTLKGRLVTGDLAKRDEEGYLTITGRKSRFIKLQGNRISLEDVERRLDEAGHKVVCVGEDDRLYVALEGALETEGTRNAIGILFQFPIRYVKVVSVAQYPRTSSGKLMYKRLYEMISEQISLAR
ncbi:AMP-binding protein [Asticcacaulis sp. DXS10W]|uniref:AMP-binding protein n=1 Tax=Asticcacaulis currens TaxID=2984210 RepID=A0ABT5I9H1_9CAUL|nr:AMP-binding protein [Asticcacaulis currens]MDC7692824.1 AMP-binding protein [Asticcacaulis currens]